VISRLLVRELEENNQREEGWFLLGFSERLWRRNLLAERASCRGRFFMAF